MCNFFCVFSTLGHSTFMELTGPDILTLLMVRMVLVYKDPIDLTLLLICFHWQAV